MVSLLWWYFRLVGGPVIQESCRRGISEKKDEKNPITHARNGV
jgi:hypothetical protein